MRNRKKSELNPSQNFLEIIGRKEYVNIVKEKIEDVSKARFYEESTSNYSIVSFYGIGGKGKTELLNKITKELVRNAGTNKPYYITWDTSEENNFSILGILVKLRNLLVESTDFTFFSFDDSIKLHNQFFPVQYNLIDYPIPKNNRVREKGIELGKVAIDAVDDYAGGFGKIALNVGKAGTDLLKSIYDVLVDKFQPGRKEEVIQSRENINLESLIINAFKNFVDDYNLNVATKEKNVIIFIDTFENIPYLEKSYEYYPLKKWLFSSTQDPEYGCGLFNSLTHTVWIFAGRDSIQEKDLQNKDVFIQKQLENFTVEETNTYLEKNLYLNDEELKKDIFDETQGYPLLLSTYFDLALTNPELFKQEDWFIKSKDNRSYSHTKKLLRRYLDYFSPNSNASLNTLLEYLIAMKTWTNEEISELCITYNLMSSKEAAYLMNIINSKSIVQKMKRKNQEGIEEIIYKFDRTFQEVMSKDGSEYIDDSVYMNTFSYLLSRKGFLRSEQIEQIINIIFFTTSSLEEAFTKYNYNVAPMIDEVLSKHLNIQFLITFLEIGLKVYPGFTDANLVFQSIIELIVKEEEYGNSVFIDKVERIINRINLEPQTVLMVSNFFKILGHHETNKEFLENQLVTLPEGNHIDIIEKVTSIHFTQDFEGKVYAHYFDNVGDELDANLFNNFLKIYPYEFNYWLHLIDSLMLIGDDELANLYSRYTILMLNGMIQAFGGALNTQDIESILYPSYLYYYTTDYKGERVTDGLNFIIGLRETPNVLHGIIENPNLLRILSEFILLALEYPNLINRRANEVIVIMIESILKQISNKEYQKADLLPIFQTFNNMLIVLLENHEYMAIDAQIDINYKVFIERYGENHPETIRTMLIRAISNYHMKEYNSSKQLLEKLYSKYNKSKKIRNHQYSLIAKYLGLTLIELSQYDGGIKYIKESYEVVKCLYGEHHIKTTSIHVEYLINYYKVSSEQENMEKLYEIYLKAQELVIKHQNTENEILYNLIIHLEEILFYILEYTGQPLELQITEQFIQLFNRINRDMYAINGYLDENLANHVIFSIYRSGYKMGVETAQKLYHDRTTFYNLSLREYVLIERHWDYETDDLFRTYHEDFHLKEYIKNLYRYWEVFNIDNILEILNGGVISGIQDYIFDTSRNLPDEYKNQLEEEIRYLFSINKKKQLEGDIEYQTKYRKYIVNRLFEIYK